MLQYDRYWQKVAIIFAASKEESFWGKKDGQCLALLPEGEGSVLMTFLKENLWIENQ